MKDRKKNKLCSNDGVSILLAMVVLLVAGMVSVVLLSASSSSVKSVTQNTKALQDGLTLDSASSLLKDTIAEEEGSTYVAYVNIVDGSISSVNYWESNFPMTHIQTISNYALVGGNAPSGSFTISVDGADKMKDVQVNYVVNSSDSSVYSVIYTLSLTMEDGTVSKRYVECNVSVQDTEQSWKKKVIWTVNTVKGKEN